MCRFSVHVQIKAASQPQLLPEDLATGSYKPLPDNYCSCYKHQRLSMSPSGLPLNEIVLLTFHCV